METVKMLISTIFGVMVAYWLVTTFTANMITGTSIHESIVTIIVPMALAAFVIIVVIMRTLGRRRPPL